MVNKTVPASRGGFEKPRTQYVAGLSCERSSNAELRSSKSGDWLVRFREADACAVHALVLGELDKTRLLFLSDRTFDFGAGSSLCAWAFLASRRAVKRAAFSRMVRAWASLANRSAFKRAVFSRMART